MVENTFDTLIHACIYREREIKINLVPNCNGIKYCIVKYNPWYKIHNLWLTNPKRKWLLLTLQLWTYAICYTKTDCITLISWWVLWIKSNDHYTSALQIGLSLPVALTLGWSEGYAVFPLFTSAKLPVMHPWQEEDIDLGCNRTSQSPGGSGHGVDAFGWCSVVESNQTCQCCFGRTSCFAIHEPDTKRERTILVSGKSLCLLLSKLL